MKDQVFLIWLHERLENVHGEHPHTDYMRKLRAIIKATPPEQYTPNSYSCNCLEELLKEMDGEL